MWALILLIVAGATEIFAQRSAMTIGLNRIEGRITDESNNGIDNVYVELYDNYGSLVNRQRSSGQGRFSFRGMQPGRYVLEVKPFGTNFAEDSKEIEINNQSSRSDTVVADFRLHPDKRFENTELGVVGTVFAQEVPAEARRLYNSGVEGIQSRPDKALAELEGAVKLFPQYFDALAALGKAHILKGRYETGYPFLLRAIDVNSKCFDCYYSLSLAFYKLEQLRAATMAIEATVVLEPKSPAARLLQGMIYRLDNKLAAAEKALLLAKSLYKVPNSEVHWQLSVVYNRLKRNQEAADELEQYLKTKSDITAAEKENVRDLIVKLRKST
jgi:tetratricopeptide (TPR) repeat protein